MDMSHFQEPAASVFVVDGDDAARAAIAALAGRSGWRTACFTRAEELLARDPHGDPCCLVLDVDPRDPGRLALQRRIAAERGEMPIIAVAGRADVPGAVQAMKAGAVDFLAKPVHGPSLLHAIEEALARSRAALRRAMDVRSIRARHGTLSRREREVMSLVARGLLNKQVGAELGISEITVKAHRGSAMRKMGARTLPDLVNMAGVLRESPQVPA